ncbi:MAG: orotidine-5'-phosphate decarboxylase [Flavobacteriales bacterium]
MRTKEAFLLEMYQLDIIKFGQFTLKSGIESPFYIDLRSLASNPTLLKTLSQHLLEMLPDGGGQLICGVPYAALPIATVMSITSGIPLIIKRKENKGYGTQKMVEGVYEKGQGCILVEDVVTSGKSLLETIDELECAGIVIKSVLVVIDREQGGKKRLREKGYDIHALFTITEAVGVFSRYAKIDKATAEGVLRFVRHTDATAAKPRKRRHLADRTHGAHHPVMQKLVETALDKETNLICAADLTTAQAVFALAQEVGEHICALKVHADIIEDFSLAWIQDLRALAAQKKFLLFADRKLADIGHTASLQFTEGVHRIATWAELITAHMVAGAGSIQAIKRRIKNRQTAVVPVLQMSTADTLTDSDYIKKALNIIQKHGDAIIAIVAQQAAIPSQFLKFTPGVHSAVQGDDSGQAYHSPRHAILNHEADFIIVGRGIHGSENPKSAAINYQNQGWKALKEV